MRATWVRTVIVAGPFLFAVGCPGSVPVRHEGTTFGEIYVDRPEVYTRERLVNDRLKQDAWLREQLELTDKLVFGVQGLADIRSFQGLSTTAGVEANPLIVQLRQARLEQELAGIGREEQLAELEHRKNVLNLLQGIQNLSDGTTNIDLVNAQAGSAEAESESGAADTEQESSQRDAEKGAAPTGVQRPESQSFTDLFGQTPSDGLRKTVGTASPIDAFRDKLAYREELRSEIIENALDDRHDLRGNTLYRLKFDATVVPERDTSAWAVVAVQLRGPFEDKGCDCRGTKEDINRLFDTWKEFITTYLNKEAQRRYYHQTDEEAETLTILSINKIEEERNEEGCWKLRESCRTPKEQRSTLNLDENLKLLAEHTLRYKRQVTPADITNELISLIAGWVKEDYEKRGLGDFLIISTHPPELRLSTDKNLQEKGEAGLLDEFCRKLLGSSESFTYAVTPKESVQRISDVASRREATQLSLALGLLLGSVNLDTLTEYAQATEGIFQAIRRQPLVVGFTEAPTENTSTGETEKLDRFGWILGPRFLITPQKDSYYFRHAPVQQSLSAIVSIPSWWDRATVIVEKYWLDEDGKRLNEAGESLDENGKKEETGTMTYDIQLPRDLTGITAALLPNWRRSPVPISIGGYRLAIGRSGRLVIRGFDLWRNPAVFLGSQQADRIDVLPNMEGIVAHFKSVEQPAGWADSDTSGEVPIYLWTSEGGTYVDKATLHRMKATGVGIRKVTISQIRLIGDSIALLKIEQGSLPDAFASLKVGVRRLNGGKDYVDIEPHHIDTERNLVRARLTLDGLKTALGSHFTEGVPLEMALKLKLHPGAQTTAHAAARAPIYYSSAEEAAVKITAKPVSDLPVAIELRVPENVQKAYPGFDSSKMALKAKVKDKPAIPLDIALVQTDIRTWEAKISVQGSAKTAWDNVHKADQVILLELETGSPDLLWKPESLQIPKGP